jgi:hypothetical protein
MMATELYPKRLQLLKDINPRLIRAAVLRNPDHPFHAKPLEELKAVAPSLSIELSFVDVRTPDQFSTAFAYIARANAQALYVVEGPHLLYSSSGHSRDGICSPTTDDPRIDTLAGGRRPHVLWA